MGVFSPRGRMSHPQWESLPHGGDQYTPPKGSLSPHGGYRPTPPGGVVQNHLHIKAASRSENDHTPHGEVLPLLVISSYSAPGEIIILPHREPFRDTHLQRRRDLKTIILPTGGVPPPRGRSSYSSPGKSFPTGGDHLIHSPPGDGVSPHRGRLSYSQQVGSLSPPGESSPTGGDHRLPHGESFPHGGDQSTSPKGVKTRINKDNNKQVRTNKQSVAKPAQRGGPPP